MKMYGLNFVGAAKNPGLLIGIHSALKAVVAASAGTDEAGVAKLSGQDVRAKLNNDGNIVIEVTPANKETNADIVCNTLWGAVDDGSLKKAMHKGLNDVQGMKLAAIDGVGVEDVSIHPCQGEGFFGSMKAKIHTWKDAILEKINNFKKMIYGKDSDTAKGNKKNKVVKIAPIGAPVPASGSVPYMDGPGNIYAAWWLTCGGFIIGLFCLKKTTGGIWDQIYWYMSDVDKLVITAVDVLEHELDDDVYEMVAEATGQRMPSKDSAFSLRLRSVESISAREIAQPIRNAIVLAKRKIGSIFNSLLPRLT